MRILATDRDAAVDQSAQLDPRARRLAGPRGAAARPGPHAGEPAAERPGHERADALDAADGRGRGRRDAAAGGHRGRQAPARRRAAGGGASSRRRARRPTPSACSPRPRPRPPRKRTRGAGPSWRRRRARTTSGSRPTRETAEQEIAEAARPPGRRAEGARRGRTPRPMPTADAAGAPTRGRSPRRGAGRSRRTSASRWTNAARRRSPRCTAEQLATRTATEEMRERAHAEGRRMVEAARQEAAQIVADARGGRACGCASSGSASSSSSRRRGPTSTRSSTALGPLPGEQDSEQATPPSGSPVVQPSPAFTPTAPPALIAAPVVAPDRHARATAATPAPGLRRRGRPVATAAARWPSGSACRRACGGRGRPSTACASAAGRRPSRGRPRATPPGAGCPPG